MTLLSTLEPVMNRETTFIEELERKSSSNLHAMVGVFIWRSLIAK
jgi:hypothetical protein